ncbi:NAD-dependent epimerase/dehydratase family protein [Streptococcus parauberis]|uniref:NAD-dependent epimerase/dehydratase family protein n=1 Tax=Streptococcus parauberis TaxID=1348 RepID=UPI000C145D1B|nr:NAD(P)-dependent oxidoreductase [Streptococcus parauberis]PIA86232.1 dTDP-6-deoxy-L-talose 4-dehydrogenase (NAD(+)) [Streptococcus parauberis]
MKILVTGANGYLGKGVVKVLLDKGFQVIATDFKSNYIDERAEIIESDLFTVENPFSFFGKPDVLIHMAWRDGFVHNSINHINDLPSHYQFLSDMVDEGLKQVSVLGSMHEVGFFEGAITENTPTNPQSLYGISKDALRNSVELLCKQNEVIFQWLRGFYIVGNTKDGSSIFSKIIQADLDGKTEFPFTLGLNQFDFINYDEFCNAVALTATQEKIIGIINICSGHPEKLADRVERFIKENNLNIKLQYGAFPDRPYDSKAVWGSDCKLSLIIENIKDKY